MAMPYWVIVSDAKTLKRPDDKQKDADGHTATVILNLPEESVRHSIEKSRDAIKNRELKDFRPFILILHSAVCTILDDDDSGSGDSGVAYLAYARQITRLLHFSSRKN